MQPTDAMPVEYSIAQNFSTHLSNKNSWTSLGKVHLIKPQTLKWNTDGSLTDEGSGLVVVGPKLEIPRINGQMHQHSSS